jgi:hypothetical protein
VTILVLVAAEAAQNGAGRVLLQSALDHGHSLEPAVDAVAGHAQQPARLHHWRREGREPRRAAQIEAEEAAVVGAAHMPAVGMPVPSRGWPRSGYGRGCGWGYGWGLGLGLELRLVLGWAAAGRRMAYCLPSLTTYSGNLMKLPVASYASGGGGRLAASTIHFIIVLELVKPLSRVTPPWVVGWTLHVERPKEPSRIVGGLKEVPRSLPRRKTWKPPIAEP